MIQTPMTLETGGIGTLGSVTMVDSMGLLELLAVTVGLMIVIGTTALLYMMRHPERRTLAYALAQKLPCDPADLGLKSAEKTLTLPDGHTTPAWVIEGLNPSGPFVAITHGWSSGRFNSLVRVPLWAQYANRLVVYDARGHGDSSANICTLGEKEPGDLLAILDQVLEADTSVVLVGISMGAGFTVAAAASEEARRHRIVGVILEGPYRLPMEPVVGHFRCRRWPPYPIVWLAGAHLRFWTKGYDQFDRVLHAAKLQCPLLVLHGAADLICPVASGQAIAEAAVQGRFVPIEGAGHSDLFERDEQTYCDAVNDFFTQTLKSPGPTHHDLIDPEAGGSAYRQSPSRQA